MIKHVVTHFLDPSGYLCSVSATLYDDGIQITSLTPDKPVRAYWPLSTLKVIADWSPKAPAHLQTADAEDTGTLLIDDKAFFKSLKKRLQTDAQVLNHHSSGQRQCCRLKTALFTLAGLILLGGLFAWYYL